AILRLRWIIIIAVSLLTGFFGYFIKDLKVNADVLGYLPENDRAAILFKEIGKNYGGNEMIIIGIEGKEVFTNEMLELIRQVTDSVRTVRGIGYVTSLTNVLDIKSTEFGIEIGRLIDEWAIPDDAAELENLKHYALSKEMYRGNLVSEDATSTLVVAKVLEGANRTDAVEEIRNKLSQIHFSGKYYYGGMPVTLLELSNVIIHDIKFIAPLAFVLICLVLLMGFRSARSVFIPMLTVLIAVSWTMGLIGLLEYQITLITNVIPVILLAVGSAYAIHVLNRINEEMDANPKQALIRAMAYVTVPVFLASLTTVFGFLSFIAGSYLTMIQQFGLFTAIGIIFSLILAVTFIPALFAAFQKESPGVVRVESSNKTLFALTKGISRLVFNNQKLLLGVWGLLVLFSCWGISRIERRVDLVDYFRKDNIVQQSEKLLKERFNGSMPLYVKISGDVQSPEVLKMMEQTQEFMEQFDYIPYSQSVADLIKQMNDVMGEGELIPDDPNKIIQLWFLLYGQEIMEQLVSYDLSEGVIQGYVASTDLEVLREIEINFSEFVEQHKTENYTLAVTGIPIMFKRLDDSIIRSQVYSLIIAILLVVMLISFLQRSFIKGLLAIIPVVATLVVLFGTMGNAGIPLDIATVLTGSVTIGIGIDYAIHFISYFGNAYQANGDVRKSIEKSIHGSGRAILINLLSVTIGFAVLLLSNLVPLQRFGFLIAVTMIISGLAALTLLPLALLLSGEKLKTIFRLKERMLKRV
ncbi:MAG TPA: RND family transporter, partial [Bacteroidales bacterium]|nr:RND family transporter [Bacteroidales bacterium]